MNVWLLIVAVGAWQSIAVPNLPSKEECERLGNEIKQRTELKGTEPVCFQYEAKTNE